MHNRRFSAACICITVLALAASTRAARVQRALITATLGPCTTAGQVRNTRGACESCPAGQVRVAITAGSTNDDHQGRPAAPGSLTGGTATDQSHTQPLPNGGNDLPITGITDGADGVSDSNTSGGNGSNAGNSGGGNNGGGSNTHGGGSGGSGGMITGNNTTITETGGATAGPAGTGISLINTSGGTLSGTTGDNTILIGDNTDGSNHIIGGSGIILNTGSISTTAGGNSVVIGGNTGGSNLITSGGGSSLTNLGNTGGSASINNGGALVGGGKLSNTGSIGIGSAAGGISGGTGSTTGVAKGDSSSGTGGTSSVITGTGDNHTGGGSMVPGDMEASGSTLVTAHKKGKDGTGGATGAKKKGAIKKKKGAGAGGSQGTSGGPYFGDTNKCIDAQEVCGTAEMAIAGMCRKCPIDKVADAGNSRCVLCKTGATKVPWDVVKNAECMSLIDVQAMCRRQPMTTCGVGYCAVTIPTCSIPAGGGGLWSLTLGATGELGLHVNLCSPLAKRTEMCNNIDDDCDGTIDNNIPKLVCGTSACKFELEACVNGVPQTCARSQTAEVCNGKDDNCNGQIDEGIRECGVGNCKYMIPMCKDGKNSVCDAPDGKEVCNGRDDDCNGLVDDGIPTITCVKDGCTYQQSSCVNGQKLTTCSLPPPEWCVAAQPQQACVPAVETCNGIDDDCDGDVDEDLGETTCGVGICKVTQKHCVAGQTKVCLPGVAAQTEACNGLDDDCNGYVDEGIPDMECAACGQPNFFIKACINGKDSVCPPVEPTQEVCNGKDDDCDGEVDEGFGTTTCGEGNCQVTVQNCANGATQQCKLVPTSDPEVCNGIDDNCNGQIDEGTITCSCGGATFTIPACVSESSNSCPTGTAEMCDGVDNDCNGQVDDGLGTMTCGAGNCAITIPNCIGGVQQSCPLNIGTGSAEVCNGIDDDCNGIVDDLPFQTCGNTQVPRCINGQTQGCPAE